MTRNFVSIYGGVVGVGIVGLIRKKGTKNALEAMACRFEAKRRTENLWLSWAVFWVLCFGGIVGGGMYKVLFSILKDQ